MGNKVDYTEEQHEWEPVKGYRGKPKFFPDDAPMVSIPRPIAIRALILADNMAYADAEEVGISVELLKETTLELNKALEGKVKV